MAVTNTSAFNLDIGEICEEAFERAGVELRTGYDLRTARRSLDLLCLEWQNRGINLWTVAKGTQVLTQGTSEYTLGSDIIDLIEYTIRTNAGDSSRQNDIPITRISNSTYSTLPNKLTEAENSSCSGPTSFKSLGTLFILSPSKTANATLPYSLEFITG